MKQWSCTPAVHLGKSLFVAFFYPWILQYSWSRLPTRWKPNMTPPRIKNLIVCTWLSFSQRCRFVKKVPWCSYSVCMSMSFPVAKLHFILLQQELNGCSHQAAASTTRHKALGRSRFGFRAPKAENGCVLCQRKTEPANNKTSWCGRSVDRLNPDNRKWNGWISLNIHNSLISKLSGLLLLSWTTIDSPSISLCHYHLQTTKSSMQTALDITSHPKLLYKQHQFWKILLWICCLKSSWKHRIWPHCFNSHRSPTILPSQIFVEFPWE